MPQKIRTENLVQAVIRELQRMIREGEFKAGDQLPSHEALADMFGVSRSTIREATQALRLVGLVQTSPGRGSYVCSDPQQLAQSARAAAGRLKELCAPKLYEARFALERCLTSLAAERATPDHIRRIKDALEGMARHLEDTREFARYDLTFHLEVADAANNELLQQFYQVSRELILEGLIGIDALPSVPENALRTHSAILAAIEEHDPAAALAAFDEWQQYVECVLSTHGVTGNCAGLQPSTSSS